MEVVITPSEEAAGALVADVIEELFAAEPHACLGLATGSSPLALYAELIRRVKSGRISFARGTAATLDEYLGLPAGHPQSYRTFLRRELVDQVDFRPDALIGPHVHAPDPQAACLDYDRTLATIGVDLQILGIGTDGHIGFNEPTSSLSSRTRIKTLTRQTRADNARFFDSIDDVPRHVITQGIGTILDAAHIVLIACGAGKAAAVARAVEGPLAAMFPASAIQFHPRATIVIDEAAATDLTLTDYYRDMHANKADPTRIGGRAGR